MVNKTLLRAGAFILLTALLVSASGPHTALASGSSGDDTPVLSMHGPDVPPADTPYDEWKGFQYADSTSFPLRNYWTIVMSDGSSPSAAGLSQDPEHIEDGLLRITDAHAEPVGGEMKLRSGGYVDITIEMQWTGTMRLTGKDLYQNFYIQWQHTSALPFDAYTGTSLLNYQGEEDYEDLGVGQAANSGMVESDVTWNGRVYRLFAKEDVRNSTFRDYTLEKSGQVSVLSLPASIDTTLTLRVPADYDGMALAIDKDITDEKPKKRNNKGEFPESKDLYADILTTDEGKKQTAGDFYFVKVSDLLKRFDK